MTATTAKPPLARWHSALPYATPFFLVPLIWFGAVNGGLAAAMIPLTTWVTYVSLDRILGLNIVNADPNASEDDLFWYKLITWVWPPIQFVTLFSVIWYATNTTHLTTLDKINLFFGVGVVTGTLGINYSHELMHQKSRYERNMGDFLLSMVLYSHFRSEHLLVHHIWVGTPRDPVTARFNEPFYKFFPRVLYQCLRSAFRAEKAQLERRGLPWYNRANPFYRYWALQGAMLALALALGGVTGLLLFLFQALIAVWHLELVNFVEHYGLTRKRLENGKYEHVMPRHSWNAAHKGSNWLLLTLQRHSDHHYKPSRRFPLLQTYSADEAPQLPYGYPVMVVSALVPRLWRRMMNPRVRKWRAKYYPEISDWSEYDKLAPRSTE
jgi:alkane 1-monooxygenase